MKVFVWALYEFGSTLFSMCVLSRYFALWVKEDLGASDLTYSLAYSGSLLLSLIGMPLFGILSDHYKRKVPFMMLSTAGVAAGTLMLSQSHSLPLILVLFALTNFAYQSSFVFFNALLPDVARQEKRVGRVAGYGVGLGYLGSIVGLLAVAPFVKAGGNHAAFFPTFVLFSIATIPALVILKDRSAKKVQWGNVLLQVGASIREFMTTSRTLKHRLPNLFYFLCANLIFSDAINTATLFMAVYARQMARLSNTEIDKFLILSTVFAIAGGLFYGKVVEKIGPLKAMRINLCLWMVALVGAMLFVRTPIFWAIGPLAGMGFGGFWVAGRSLMVKLAPPEEIGKFFGMYALTEKFTAVLGPIFWGATITFFASLGREAVGYRLAVGELLCAVCLGFWVLRKVRT